MKISVIIAAYRGEKYITEQLESLLNQVRLPDEVLVGDDSPDDLTGEKIEEFRRAHSPLPFLLTYIKNKERAGVNANFHSLAQAAAGDIVFFCDQDDCWLPEKIKLLSEKLENDPECEVVCCFSTFCDARLTPWERQDDSEIKVLHKNSQKEIFKLFTRCALTGAGHNIAIRKRLLDHLPVWEWDYYFLYDSWIMRSSAAAECLRFVCERLTLHRVHGENTTKHAEKNFKNSVFMRMKNNGTQELDRLLKEWKLFRKNLYCSLWASRVSATNRKLLDECISYLEKRVRYRSKNIFSRTFLCILLLPGYFQFGNGFRSLLRDIGNL